jgi:hypothetical protein
MIGEGAANMLGIAIAGVGDTNGDSIDDMLVAERPSTVAAYLVLGPDQRSRWIELLHGRHAHDDERRRGRRLRIEPGGRSRTRTASTKCSSAPRWTLTPRTDAARSTPSRDRSAAPFR